MLIGSLIGLWHLSGTIPAMIYYGIQVVNPSTFYLSVFLVAGAVAMLLGTSLGTISTLGVPTAGYLPYAFLCWLTPLAAVVLGYILTKKPAEDGVQ